MTSAASATGRDHRARTDSRTDAVAFGQRLELQAVGIHRGLRAEAQLARLFPAVRGAPALLHLVAQVAVGVLSLLTAGLALALLALTLLLLLALALWVRRRRLLAV